MPRLVIGCGAARHNHGVLGHVTMDINLAMMPTIHGSITDVNSDLYMDPLYRHHFDQVMFENIPANIIASDADCYTVASHLTVVMTANGRVYFKAGAVARARVPRLVQIFRQYNFVKEAEFFDGKNVKLLDKYNIDMIQGDPTRDIDMMVDEEPVDLVFKRGCGQIRSIESPI